MDENVKALAVQHQPRHDVLELRDLEEQVELGERKRASRLIPESAGLYSELAEDRVAKAFGNRPGGGIVIDVGVIAFEFAHACSCRFARQNHSCLISAPQFAVQRHSLRVAAEGFSNSIRSRHGCGTPSDEVTGDEVTRRPSLITAATEKTPPSPPARRGSSPAPLKSAH